MRNFKIIVGLLTIALLFSCTNRKKKKNAIDEVRKFYSALRVGNEQKMEALYEDVLNVGNYYKSDTALIKESKFGVNEEIEIKTINQYTSDFGKKFNQEIVFYLKPDSINELDYHIYDSKGLCGYDDNPYYTFAQKTGCIEKQDITDQQIAKKMIVAYKLLIFENIDVYIELKKGVNVVKWSWETSWSGAATGKGIVKNNTTFELPKLEYKITYKDNYGNEITSDDGYVTYDMFYSGESKSFTFYTSYIGGATKASIEFIFDNKMIMDYNLTKNYTGNEYQEYIANKNSTKNK